MKYFKGKLLLFFKPDLFSVLKGFLCITIIMIHAPYPQNGMESRVKLIMNSAGESSIFLFFFISGILLGFGYLKGKYPLSVKGVARFYLKRLVSIVPLYYLTVFFLFYMTPASYTERTADLFSLLTFQSSTPKQLFSSGYLWFIPTIIHLYILAPIGFLIMKILSGRSNLMKLILFFLILLLGCAGRLYVLSKAEYTFLYSSWQTNIAYFISGMVFSQIISEIKSFSGNKKISKVAVYLFSILILSLLYILNLRYLFTVGDTRLRYFAEFIGIPAVSILFVSLIVVIWKEYVYRRPDIREKFPFIKKAAVLLNIIGIYSFEIYLFHQPVLTLLNLPCTYECSVGRFMQNILIVLFLSFCVAVFADFLVQGFIEKLLFKNVKGFRR